MFNVHEKQESQQFLATSLSKTIFMVIAFSLSLLYA